MRVAWGDHRLRKYLIGHMNGNWQQLNLGETPGSSIGKYLLRIFFSKAAARLEDRLLRATALLRENSSTWGRFLAPSKPWSNIYVSVCIQTQPHKVYKPAFFTHRTIFKTSFPAVKTICSFGYNYSSREELI